MKSSSFFKRFYSNFKGVKQENIFLMEDKLKCIFSASVDAVKPSELITKNKLLSFADEKDRKFMNINIGQSLKKFDVTGKNIHIGELAAYLHAFYCVSM